MLRNVRNFHQKCPQALLARLQLIAGLPPPLFVILPTHPFCPAQSAEQKSGANMPQLKTPGTPKNLTSDWLIVTALTSVIGHMFTASASSVSVGRRVHMCITRI